MRIGNLDLQLGQTAQGMIAIGETQMPIRVARGSEDGPIVWVNAAIHGDELEGTAALWRVFDTIAPVPLRGTLIGALITNVSAFNALRRTSPIDDLDLNRVFPGEPNLSFTWQFAFDYKKVVESVATHYIDLHGGGNTHDVVFYSIYRDGDGEASRISREMAQVAGSPIVWSSRDAWLDHGLFTLLTGRGIPSLIVEAGGEGRIRPRNVAAHSGSVLNVLKHLGMIPGSVSLAEIAVPVQSADFFFSHRGGIWTSDLTVGDQVLRGDLVGIIRDPYGSTLEEIRCKSGEAILLALRTYAAAPTGSNLGILGVVEE